VSPSIPNYPRHRMLASGHVRSNPGLGCVPLKPTHSCLEVGTTFMWQLPRVCCCDQLCAQPQAARSLAQRGYEKAAAATRRADVEVRGKHKLLYIFVVDLAVVGYKPVDWVWLPLSPDQQSVRTTLTLPPRQWRIADRASQRGVGLVVVKHSHEVGRARSA